MQKLTASSRWSNFTHKDTEKNRKSQNFKIVLNRRETDSRVSLAKIRGQKSLKFENDGMGTGLKYLFNHSIYWSTRRPSQLRQFTLYIVEIQENIVEI